METTSVEIGSERITVSKETARKLQALTHACSKDVTRPGLMSIVVIDDIAISSNGFCAAVADMNDTELAGRDCAITAESIKSSAAVAKITNAAGCELQLSALDSGHGNMHSVIRGALQTQHPEGQRVCIDTKYLALVDKVSREFFGVKKDMPLRTWFLPSYGATLPALFSVSKLDDDSSKLKFVVMPLKG